jgi:hypothetical protein
MDNPAYFTVAWRADGTDWDFTDAGLLGSLQAARDETAKHQANNDVPDLVCAPAVISMLDQDPVSGTPMNHLNPPNATGYAMASLNVADPARRSLDHTLYQDFETVLGIAEGYRRNNRCRGNDNVVDIVVVTVIFPSEI